MVNSCMLKMNVSLQGDLVVQVIEEVFSVTKWRKIIKKNSAIDRGGFSEGCSGYLVQLKKMGRGGCFFGAFITNMHQCIYIRMHQCIYIRMH